MADINKNPLLSLNGRKSSITSLQYLITQAIESGVQKAVGSLIPNIVQKIRSELRSTINEIVEDKLKQMKEEMQLRSDFENRKLELIALSESEVLENYIRRENIKILDMPESHQSGQRESYQQTAAVIDLARRLKVSVTENGISIAHRLPASTGTQNRPVIAQFSRRMAKIEFLKTSLMFLFLKIKRKQGLIS